MAPDSENYRGLHAVRVLTGISGVTLDKLIAIAYDTYLPGFEQLIPGLIEAYEQSGESPALVTDAIDVLRDWDYRVSVDSVALTLAYHYGIALYERGEIPDETSDASFIEIMNELGTGSNHEERLRIFTETVAMLQTDLADVNLL